MMKQFFGKYRGKVTANQDPNHLGRIRVTVPAVYGEGRQSWAMPCTPYAGGPKKWGLFTIPPVDTNVWVEFEGGDPDYPIWSGCFWGKEELPEAALVDDPTKVQVFRTDGITLTLSSQDSSKGVTLEVDSPVVENPLKLVMNPDGIELNNNDTLTAKFLTQAEIIELKNGNNTTVTLATDSIQLKESNIEIKLTGSTIELICNPATVTLSNSAGIELKNTPATATLSSSGIELSSTPAAVTIGAVGVEAKSGGLGNINISPASVSVNNGALDVT
jgi:hypothetical protein